MPGFNNSLDGGDCIKWRTLCDDLAAAELPEVITHQFTVCYNNRFKKQLDSYISTVPDSPGQPGFNIMEIV